MTFTLTAESQQAQDIGYLLHKHPDNIHESPLSFGTGYVFYPLVEDDKIAMTFALDIDPLILVRGRRGESSDAYPLQHYVNDRPYVCNSFVSVAISKTFRSALNGMCKQKPELLSKEWDLEVEIPTLSVKGGERYIKALFEPLGYQLTIEPIPLDTSFSDWGASSFYSVTLKGKQTIKNVLSHLYVLFPVLDNNKHYWLDESEVEKLLLKGEDWLKDHPFKEDIVNRYLFNLKTLTRSALEILLDEDEKSLIETEKNKAQQEEILEEKISLNKIRLKQVVEVLNANEVSTVIDLGCGDGKLLKLLLKDKNFTKILGVDVSKRELNIAKERLKIEDLPDRMKKRISLELGSVIYRDKRFSGFDALTLIEVIEHLELNRLIHLERVVFEYAAPKVVIVTTPNFEYNTLFNSLSKDKLRHGDHRFEWTRKQFQDWCHNISKRYSYQLEFQTVGSVDEKYGSPSQMGVFIK